MDLLLIVVGILALYALNIYYPVLHSPISRVSIEKGVSYSTDRFFNMKLQSREIESVIATKEIHCGTFFVFLQQLERHQYHVVEVESIIAAYQLPPVEAVYLQDYAFSCFFLPGDKLGLILMSSDCKPWLLSSKWRSIPLSASAENVV